MPRPQLTADTPGMFVESGMKTPILLRDAMHFRPFSEALFLAHNGRHVYTPSEIEKAMETDLRQ